MAFESYKRHTAVGAFLIGATLLIAAFYLFLRDGYFVVRANPFDAILVEVRHQSVQKGKGSVLAYVPVVEIITPAKTVRVSLQTFNEDPVYNVGASMRVLCDSSFQKCIEDRFFEKWGNPLLAFALSFIFLGVPLVYWRASGTRFTVCSY